MADYVAREWSGGDIVTAANLNHLEQGVETAQGGGVLIIEESTTENNNATTHTLNKTWQEIHDAMIGGTICLVHQSESDYEAYLSILKCRARDGAYGLVTDDNMYTSTNPTMYPAYNKNPIT